MMVVKIKTLMLQTEIELTLDDIKSSNLIKKRSPYKM